METRRLLAAVASVALSASALADLDLSVIAEIRLGKAAPPPPPEVVVVEESGPKGPPPWAPAHGFRRNRGYYYYPGTNVYYRPADRMWFFLDGRDWRAGVSLPTSFRVDFTRSVSLEMETDRPYEFHRSVAEYYPADYFTRKVKVKGREKSPGQTTKAVPANSSDSDSGRGKGKGKGKGR